MNARTIVSVLVFLTLLAGNEAAAVTVDSSSGWTDATAPVGNTIDGIFGSSNRGKANVAAWVIYDFGAGAPITKVRMCAPTYSGSGSQTVNPTTSSLSFSNDKVNWANLQTSWSCPALESTNRIDMSEIAISQASGYRYAKWSTLSGGQVGEFFFISGPQLAVREMAQSETYTNGGRAAWKTVDGDPATYGEGINTEGIITYDQGASKQIYGFTMQGRADTGSVNPTSGELWVSTSATTGYVLAGTWTLPALAAGQVGTVDFGVSSAVTGRYIQLRNLSGGSAWAEFKVLSHVVHNGQATTAIIIPDSTFTIVQYAATELQYHIKKATGVTIPIYAEASKPAGCQGLIYLGACTATQKAGLSSASVGANGFISKRYGNDAFIVGDDSAGATLGANWTRVGTLFGVYDFLESRMGVKWLWPGESGEVIPQTAELATPDLDKSLTPQIIHGRIRDWSWSGYDGWATTQARDKYQTDQGVWLRRQRFAISVNLDIHHAFTEYWSRFSTTHPDYFNLLPDGTRRSDPTYYGGAGSLISMDVSNPALWSQIVADWQVNRSASDPYVDASENDTPGDCTCSTCMAWDVPVPGTEAWFAGRLARATAAFPSAGSAWSAELGNLADRYCKFYLAVQTEARKVDPGTTVMGLAYANYSKPPVSTMLNDKILIAIVPEVGFPWTDAKVLTSQQQWLGWANTGCKMMLRPNYFLDGHNYPIFYADRFGDAFTYAYAHGLYATDFDSLTGQWAAAPLNFYTLGRKHAHGDEPTTETFNGFYSAFGPAETAVRNYFGYLKQVSDAVTDAQMAAAGSNFYEGGNVIFTPAILATARSYMTLAQQAAVGNPTATARVAFLEKGLHHTELQCVAAQAWKGYISATSGLLAWTNAINALDSFRASVEMDAVANMNCLRATEDRTWQRTIPKMPVTGGHISTLHGDSLQIDQGNFLAMNKYGSEVYLVLDLGQSKAVDKILLTNRIDTSTNYNPNAVTIYVAPDESAASFDPYSKLSYTTQVFAGSFTPAVNTTGTVRSVDITNSIRRYIMLKVTSNFWGLTSDASNSNSQYVYFGNLDVSLVPDSTPPTGSIVIDSGSVYATSTNVTLSLSATDATSGVSQMRLGNDNSTWTTWEGYTASKSWTLPTGDGYKTVYVQYKDGTGNGSSSFSDSIILNSGGLDMTGMLVSVWGKVRYRSPDGGYIYIDDGSNLSDLSGHPGLRIVFNTVYNYIAPASVPQVDEYAMITGVAVKHKEAGMSSWIPAVAPRDTADIAR